MGDLAAEARASDPERLADGLVLVLNGVYVTATATVLGPESPESPEDPARRIAELGRRLVEAACDGPGRP
ncbi:hypothetical protein AB0465_01230 [Streptomyces griseoviridis]|uniref:hypothetical protein n=1 Tax=Streptomyces griseoviridis TaxID=45398 RepID=UPI00344D632A